MVGGGVKQDTFFFSIFQECGVRNNLDVYSSIVRTKSQIEQKKLQNIKNVKLHEMMCVCVCGGGIFMRWGMEAEILRRGDNLGYRLFIYCYSRVLNKSEINLKVKNYKVQIMHDRTRGGQRGKQKFRWEDAQMADYLSF